MCGIYCYLSKNGSDRSKGFDRIKRRGPDDSKLVTIHDGLGMGFHRLAINDLTDAGMQPITFKDVTVICNGEIYNYKELAERFNIKLTTTCDCEIIAKLYDYLDGHMMELLQLLDGVFAMVLYDASLDALYAARDIYGVRPLYMGIDTDSTNGFILFASESKAMIDYGDQLVEIGQLTPGSMYMIDKDFQMTYRRYYDHEEEINNYKCKMMNVDTNINDVIYDQLTNAVKKRMMSDRPIGFLLSGGLDSSLIAGIASKLSNDKQPIHTFCIGLEGATDLAYAKKVADYIGSIHHEVVVTEDEFFNAIPDVIEAIESYDITTVRASVGNYLIGKYIKENTDRIVIFNGDGSDEMGGYKYLQNAPNDQTFQEECMHLLTNIHYFDVLRSDRCMSSHSGLETRTPFLDRQFVENYMSIDPSAKMFNTNGIGINISPSDDIITNKIEKMPLRNAFEGKCIIPNEVLWRRKEAFSDGCSAIDNSWHKIIKRRLADIDRSLTEEQYYKDIYYRLYPKFPSPIPHYWMPKWVGNDVTDPSARELILMA